VYIFVQPSEIEASS